MQFKIKRNLTLQIKIINISWYDAMWKLHSMKITKIIQCNNSLNWETKKNLKIK